MAWLWLVPIRMTDEGVPGATRLIIQNGIFEEFPECRACRSPILTRLTAMETPAGLMPRAPGNLIVGIDQEVKDSEFARN